MIDSSVLGAVTKLVAASLTAAPGPMLGEHGRLDPGFRFGYMINGTLQDALDDVIQHKLPSVVIGAERSKYAFAVADLTNDPGIPAPAYAGSNDTQYMYVASLAKILPLYAAYQLRSDLRALSTETGSTDLGHLATEARSRYRSMNASTSTTSLKLPKIETFFTINSGKVDFAFDDKSDADLDTAYDNLPLLNILKAREHLRLMVGWSDNGAATLVIKALGFKYLWSFTKRSGLYRSGWNKLTRHDNVAPGPGGLFVGRDYQGEYWGHGLEERDWTVTPPLKPSQAATARSITYFMAMLAQESLIDHETHCGIYEMLRKDSSFSSLPLRGEDSPIGLGMNQAGWTAVQPLWDYEITSPPASTPADPTMPLAVSKIGAAPGDVSNALLVRTRRGAVDITAVLVAINNNPSDNNWDVLEKFGEEMAKKLDQRHGVGP